MGRDLADRGVLPRLRGPYFGQIEQSGPKDGWTRQPILAAKLRLKTAWGGALGNL